MTPSASRIARNAKQCLSRIGRRLALHRHAQRQELPSQCAASPDALDHRLPARHYCRNQPCQQHNRHDLTTALRWCDHVVVLDDGRVAAAGAPDQVLTPELLAAVWGVRAEILRAADGTPTIAYLGPAAPDSGR